MKIKKNDTVRIISGKDKGKKGKVLRVLPEKNKIVVDGLNLLTKNRKPRKEGEKGQRIKFPAPMNVSNAMLICPKCNEPTRVGHRITDEKQKVSICKKCKEII